MGVRAGVAGLAGAELEGRPGKVLSLERAGKGLRGGGGKGGGGGGLGKKSVSGGCCLLIFLSVRLTLTRTEEEVPLVGLRWPLHMGGAAPATAHKHKHTSTVRPEALQHVKKNNT